MRRKTLPKSPRTPRSTPDKRGTPEDFAQLAAVAGPPHPNGDLVLAVPSLL